MEPKLTRFLRRRFFKISLALVSCFSCLWLFGLFSETSEPIEYRHVRFAEHDECKHFKTIPKDVSKSNPPKKVILFYTTIYGRITVFYPEELHCCEPFNCEITMDKSRLLQSDAVIFHGRDLPLAKDMPKQRTTEQRWLFYTMESPFHSKIVAKDFNSIFNWTMTYERRSEVYEPYGYYERKLDAIKESMPRNYASGKDKLLAFVNSHCQTFGGFRENYVRALNKIVKVDVYGECGGIFGRVACPRWSEKCAQLLKRYKFYVSFENSICGDYITEKYWNVPFEHDTVPIIFGPKFFKELAIPGSYINAAQFKDVQSLVQYLKYLDKNDTAYNEYFKWRQYYQTANLEPWPCRLCRILHNDSLPVKTYKHFDKFLDENTVCTRGNVNL